MDTPDRNLEGILNKVTDLVMPNIVNNEIISYLCTWDSEVIKPEDLIKHYQEYHMRKK